MSIKTQNISKHFGEQKALDDVSFEINSGEIVGFLGPNGAGKSTMMKIITGYIPQTSGNVFVDGLNIDNDPLESKKRIGYLPENNPLYYEMFIREYLLFIAGIYKIQNPKKRVEEIIELCGLEAEHNKLIGSLSKGYKQRVGLAQALIHNPGVLILDEPTTGLDPNQIIEIRNLITQIGKNKTIMLSTHIMQEVEAICDKIIIIDKGKIVANDTTTAIQAFSRSPEFSVVVEFKNPVEKKNLLKINNINYADKLTENQWIVNSSTGFDIRGDIFQYAVDSKNQILTMFKQEKSLENIFRELTAK